MSPRPRPGSAMSGPYPALTLFCLAAVAAVAAADGCHEMSRGEAFVKVCNTTPASIPCCGVVFASVGAGGFPCLCRVTETPYVVRMGLGSRYFLKIYEDCNGDFLRGEELYRQCDEHPDVAGAPSPPPPPVLTSEPKKDPSAVYVTLPSDTTHDTHWFVPLIEKGIIVLGVVSLVLIICGSLIICLYKGGPGAAGATSVGGFVERINFTRPPGVGQPARGEQIASSDTLPTSSFSDSTGSPPSPRLRPPHQAGPFRRVTSSKVHHGPL